jgi:hypothetical protein
MKDQDSAVTEYLRNLGSRGGKRRAKMLSPKRRQEIASKAAKARWSKKKPKGD